MHHPLVWKKTVRGEITDELSCICYLRGQNRHWTFADTPFLSSTIEETAARRLRSHLNSDKRARRPFARATGSVAKRHPNFTSEPKQARLSLNLSTGPLSLYRLHRSKKNLISVFQLHYKGMRQAGGGVLIQKFKRCQRVTAVACHPELHKGRSSKKKKKKSIYKTSNCHEVLIELTKALSTLAGWIQTINYGWFSEIGIHF